MSSNLPPIKPRPERLDGRLFLTDENLDRGTLTLLAAARRLEVYMRQLVETKGLSQTEFAMLMEIAHEPGLDVSDLRTRVGGTTPTIARLLARLEKDGWVDRPKANRDGRRRALRLSPDGDALVEEALSALRKNMTQIYRQAGEPSVTGAMDLLASVSHFSPEGQKP